MKNNVLVNYSFVKFFLVSSNLVTPFLSILMIKGFGLELSEIGQILSLSSFCYVLGNIFGGFASDKVNPIFVFLSALFFAFISLFFLSRVDEFFEIILAVGCFSFFISMPNPIFNLLLSNSLGKDDISKGYTQIYMVHNAASASMYFLGGYFIESYGKWILHVFSVYLILVIPLVAYCLLRVNKSIISKDDNYVGKSDSDCENVNLKPMFLFICVQFFLLALLDAQFQFLIPTWVNDQYPLTSGQFFGYVGLINGLVVLSLSPLVMKLSKSFSTQVNLGIAALFYGLGFLIIMIPHWFAIIVVSTITWTIGEIMAANYFNIYVAANTLSSTRGRLFSIPPLLLALGKVLGVPVIAWTTTNYGFHFAWLALSGIAGIGVLLSIIYYLNQRKKYEIGNRSTSI